MTKGLRPQSAPKSVEAREAKNEELTQAQRSIGERVRFWEEQEKINQVLIDRLIRLNKLLSDHIKNHESLPEVADQAVRQALADARVEQQEQYRSIIENLSATYRDSVHTLLAEERTRQRQQYEHALATVDQQWKTETQRNKTRLHTWLAKAIGLLALLSIISLILSILSLTAL
ncbi:MAG: hypothetical protein OXG64_04480 [Chloroflexi bacterium]|nr:hypothetical protein [Chloroflexota bacterium]